MLLLLRSPLFFLYSKTMPSKRTVLITGSAGFIGTNLTKYLLASGDRVIGFDNFYSGSPENVKLFEKNSNYLFLKHDVRQPLPVEEKLDRIYHLACPASPLIYQKDPLFTLETNILGTVNALKLARKNRCRVLHASTSEIYGNPLKHPQKETDWGHVNPIGPRSCYDEGKRAAETLCREYKNLGVDVRIVRIFNTYGPLMNPADGRVVSNFIIQALNSQPLTVQGNGQQTRSFCHIDDLIKGMTAYLGLKECYFGPINLGNPNEITILKLAKTILALIPQSKSKISYRPLPEDDPVHRRPDISRARKMLKWQPTVSLTEGLTKTIDYFIKLIS